MLGGGEPKTIYFKNVNDLPVLVDNNAVDNQYIASIYFRGGGNSSDFKPYVEMYERGDDGKIVEETIVENGRTTALPVTYKVYGDIRVVGDVQTCGCWRKKRIAYWWHRLNQGRAGW